MLLTGHILNAVTSSQSGWPMQKMACLTLVGSQRWYKQMLVDLPAALAVEQRIRQNKEKSRGGHG